MYKVFADKTMQATVKKECENAEIGCVQCKSRLAGIINEKFAPFRERRESLAKDPDQVFKLLEHGNVKARKVAKQTLHEVREIMGMVNWNSLK
jgi:tryptophanyl-tRNA synthetase